MSPRYVKLGDPGDLAAEGVHVVDYPYAVVVSVRGERSDPAYPRFEAMTQRWGLTISLRYDGLVTDASGWDDGLAGVDVCTTPDLSPADAIDAILGKRVPYSTIAGEHVESNPVERDNITSLELVFFRLQEPERITLRLAYAIRAAGDFTFVVDAGTGELLDAHPNGVS